MRRALAKTTSHVVWFAIVVGVLAIALAVMASPLAAAAAVIAAVVLVALVRSFGPLEGLWYLAVAALPLRHALAIDVMGTASLFPTDVLFILLLALAYAGGHVRGLLRKSLTLRLGVAILLLSLPGLFTASRLFWGVAAIYRIGVQLSAFVVAFVLAREGRVARRTLWALLLGVAPVAIYGLYQSNFPVGSAALPQWARHLTAYSAAGEPHLRVFSTFDHPLRFSHYLSVCLGIALGFVIDPRSRARRLLAGALAALVAYANLFTYSIAGFLGMVTAMVVSIFQVRARRVLFWLAPAFVAGLLVASPAALLNKADRVLSGEATTAAARLITYRQAFEVMKDHPLLGLGWGGLRSSMENEYRVTRARAVAFAAENYFLHRGTALGLPGLLLYVWIAVLLLRNLVRSARAPADWPRAALTVAALTYYVQAQSYPAASPEGCVSLWVLLALAERARMAGERAGVGERDAPPVDAAREVSS